MVSLIPRPPPFSVLPLCSMKYMEAEERTEEKNKQTNKQTNKMREAWKRGYVMVGSLVVYIACVPLLCPRVIRAVDSDSLLV